MGNYNQYPPPPPPGYGPPGYGPPGYGPPPGSYPGKGMSIAGMVLGIVGLVFTFFGLGLFIGIPASIVGLVLSIIGRNKAMMVGAPMGMATAGFITSIVALGISVIGTVICLAMCSSILSPLAMCGGLGYYW